MKWKIFFNHLFGALFFIVLFGYFAASLTSIIMNYQTLGVVGIILNVFVLLFELLGPVYATYLMIQLFDGIMEVGKISYDVNGIKNYPKVAVIIPIHNVNPKLLDETLDGCKKITYPNIEVWVGDDCSEKKYAVECERLVQKYGFNFHKGKARSFKAGIINQITPKLDAKYITIFDVDQIPVSDIITKFVTILEQHPEYSFVQGKYESRNVSNLLHIWEALSSFQLFCSQGGKRRIKTVIFHGTSACLRKEISYPLPENHLSEDFEHLLRITMQGHYGYFLNEVASLGLVTESIDHKISQLYRWTTGQVSAFRNNLLKFFKSKITFRQFLDYFVSSTFVFLLTAFYFMGIFYSLMYWLKIDVVRGLELSHITSSFNDLLMVFMPMVVGIVYFIAFIAVGIYSRNTNAFRMKAWHLAFFTIYGGLIAPFLLIPTFKGMFGRNKVVPGKTKWNKKIRIILIASIFTIVGLIFATLGIISLLDSIGIINRYGVNYFYPLFFIMAITLIMALPFVLISKKAFNSTKYFVDEDSQYF